MSRDFFFFFWGGGKGVREPQSPVSKLNKRSGEIIAPRHATWGRKQPGLGTNYARFYVWMQSTVNTSNNNRNEHTLTWKHTIWCLLNCDLPFICRVARSRVLSAPPVRNREATRAVYFSSLTSVVILLVRKRYRRTSNWMLAIVIKAFQISFVQKPANPQGRQVI